MKFASALLCVSTSATTAFVTLAIAAGGGIATAQAQVGDLAPRGGPTVSSQDDAVCLQLPDARTDGECPCVTPADLVPTTPVPANVDELNIRPAETIIVVGDCY